MLTDAAIASKVDNLLGLKENVIMGHLIPAGTGLKRFRNIIVSPREEEVPVTLEALAEQEIQERKKVKKAEKSTESAPVE